MLTHASTAVNWQQVCGQPQAIQILTQALAQGRLAQGYLFYGPSGVGKALSARLFVQALLDDVAPQPEDLLWLEPSYKKGEKLFSVTQAQAEGLSTQNLPQIYLEQIREVTRFLSHYPARSSRRVVVIEGADLMNERAANAFLKTLEEPQNNVLILLANQLHLVLPTVRSRAQAIPFHRLAVELLHTLVPADHYDPYPPELLMMAQGSAGELIRIIKQFQRMPKNLLDSFFPWPCQSLPLLRLAREIDLQLDGVAQRWLIDYLQQKLWLSLYEEGLTEQTRGLAALEDLRKQLMRHVQPRLAWEVALLTTLPD